jgi:mannosyltransferase OCH1-like enzyme
MIPRVIHQTWKVAEVPAQFRDAQHSWRRQHPDWSYRLWTHADMDEFVRAHYPQVWDLYRRYPDQIQRCDAVRYMILHRLGGVYSDLDIVSLRPIDDLLDCDVMLPKTDPIGVSCDLMAARPGHAFFAHLIDQLPAAYARWQHWYIPRHFRVLLTTGPLFLTAQYRAFAGKQAIKILPPDQYGAVPSPSSYLRHIPGNTWAGWDTHVFTFLNRHWRWLLGGLAVIGLAALIIAQ